MGLEHNDKFSGTWKDADDTMVVIKDALLCGMEGHPITLNSNGNICSFESGDQPWQGVLLDDSRIQWDDGEVWHRLDCSNVNSEEAMEEEKLRQKIAAYIKRRPELLGKYESRESEEDAARRVAQAERIDRMVHGERRLGMLDNSGPSSTASLEDTRSKNQVLEDRARQAYEEGSARKSAALQQDRARQAYEEGRARKSAALERARATRALQQAEEAARPSRFDSLAMPESGLSTAGLPTTSTSQDRARQVFEKEKARKAAALERARNRGSERVESPEPGFQEFEQAKARSEAGIDRAKRAFEEEKARKAAALERARAKASARQEEAMGSSSLGRPDYKRPLVTGGLGKGPFEQRQEELFTPGQHVKIIGLSSQPDLNGQIATLVRYSADKGRWQARIPGRSSILVKPENLVQATAEEKARATHSPGPGTRGKGKGKDGGREVSLQCTVEIAPGEDGNDFDVKFCDERSMQLALEKIVGVLAQRGIATCEANTPMEIITGAYEEALALWKSGEFGPVMAHMEGRPEAQVWQEVLHQSEEKAFWIREDLRGPRSMDSLKIISRNMWDLCHVLAEELFNQMGISYTNFWSAMLACYCGDKTYNLHLDNPNGSDESGVPDNGLRLTLCYYINPYWEPKGPAVSYCGGGLDAHLTAPWETPPSLLAARKAPVMRIAPHADTLVIFLSQRMAHRVVATHGNDPWFALWVWCWDQQVKDAFDIDAANLVKDVC